MTRSDQIPTPLSVLREYQKAQDTRHSLGAELESALASYLSTPSSLSSPSSNPSTDLSSCATEAIRPPNEAELSEVMRIGFEGLMEVKDQMEDIAARLELVMRRIDLAKLVRKIEGLEDERLKTTLQRDQLRRLAVLDPSADFADAIKEADQKRQQLASDINEEAMEIRAEIAELSATAEDEEQVPVPSLQNGHSSSASAAV